ERIADAALKILVEEGADAVTMRRVAAAVGLTPMATYRHYSNREELLRSVADAAFADLTGRWGRRGTGPGMGSRVEGPLGYRLGFALGTPHLYTFLLTDRRKDARRYPDDFRAGESPTFEPLRGPVEQWMAEGLLREDDPVEVSLALTSSIQ